MRKGWRKSCKPGKKGKKCRQRRKELLKADEEEEEELEAEAEEEAVEGGSSALVQPW